MLSYFQAVLLGLLQGLSELFPISSLGHTLLIPPLLGWKIDQSANAFLLFLVATHFATAVVLFVFFLKDWMRIIKGFFRSLAAREIRADDADAKLAWLLIVATIPAGILGLLFEETLKKSFALPLLTAIVLALNGAMLFFADHLHRKLHAGKSDLAFQDARIAKLSWGKAIGVGCMQALALIPGISRTGSTLTGGLLAGLAQEDAARFSFLLATPIIAAAALLKLPELLVDPVGNALGPIVVGMLCSAGAAYVAIRFLTRYLKSERLAPFAWYCLIAGSGMTLLFALR